MDVDCDLHYFHGLSLYKNGPFISHFMYLDDVKIKFLNLNILLHFFFISLGLNVNLPKGKVFRICVDNLEVDKLASIIKYKPNNFPFTYLGLLVGVNMKLAKN
uniref:Reverse transcriptase domain-containing protein n=1 Tax=Lactuca sativa TaxID=4236 RepID=A0A9R1V415_LACSA|nr:hypothetical protein LSAT_V11C700354220 [Lactuca sativa]